MQSPLSSSNASPSSHLDAKARETSYQTPPGAQIASESVQKAVASASAPVSEPETSTDSTHISQSLAIHAEGSLDLQLEDINGIEQSGHGDIVGNLSGELRISEASLKNALQRAADDIAPFEVEWVKEPGSYRIRLHYPLPFGKKITPGSLIVKPAVGGLEVQLGGLTGMGSHVIHAGSQLLNQDVEAKASALINRWAHEVGLHVSSEHLNRFDLQLAPQKMPLLREFPVGNQVLRLEQWQATENQTVFHQNGNGDLSVDLHQIPFVASSAHGSAPAVPDQEGGDQLQVHIEARTNGQKHTARSTTQLNLHITEHERDTFSAALAQALGQEIRASGQISIHNLKNNVALENGELQHVRTEESVIQAPELHLAWDNTRIDLHTTQGQLEARSYFEGNGHQVQVNSNDLVLTGDVESGKTRVQVNELALDGTVDFDEAQHKLRFDTRQRQGLSFSGQVSTGDTVLNLQQLKLQNAALETDLANAYVRLRATEGTPELSLQQLQLRNTLAIGASIKGQMALNLPEQRLWVDATEIQFNHLQHQNLQLSNLSLEGQILADTTQGLQLRQKGNQTLKLEQLQAGDLALNGVQATGQIDLKPTAQGQEHQGIQINARQAKVQAAQLRSGNIQVEQLTLQGNLEYNEAQKSLTFADADVQAQRVQAGDVHLKGLHAQGTLSMESIEQGEAIALRQSQQQRSRVEQLNVDNVAISGVSFQGDLTYRTAAKTLSFQSAGSAVARLQVDDVTLEDIGFTGDFQFQNSKIQLTQKGAESLHIDRLAVDKVSIAGISARSHVNYDLEARTIHMEGQHIGIEQLQVDKVRLESLSSAGTLDMQFKEDTVSLKQTADQQTTLKKLTLGSNTLEDIQLQGNIEVNTDTGALDLDANHFQFKGRIGGLELKHLSGNGQLRITEQGQLDVAQVNDLKVEVENLKASGDFTLAQTPQGLKLSPLPTVEKEPKQSKQPKQSPVLTVSGTVPASVTGDTPIVLEQLVFNGEVFHQSDSTLIQGSGDLLTLQQGRIGDFDLKDLNIQGALRYGKTKGIQFTPGSHESLKVSGTLGPLHLNTLQSDTGLTLNPTTRALQWDGELQADLPAYGIAGLEVSGPLALRELPSGEIELQLDGTKFSGSFGELQVNEARFQGTLRYHPQHKTLTLNGVEFAGRLNGEQVNLQARDGMQIQDYGRDWLLSGTGLRVNYRDTALAAIDAPGKLRVSKDFKHFDIPRSDITLSLPSAHAGVETQLTAKESGFQVQARGEVHLKDIESTLKEVSGLLPETQQLQDPVGDIEQALENSPLKVKGGELTLSESVLDFDHRGQLRTAQLTAAGQLHQLRLETAQGKLPLNTLHFGAKLNYHGESEPPLQVPEASLSFHFEPELRKAAAAQLTALLESQGIEDVELSIGANGEISVDNLSYRLLFPIRAEIALDVDIHDKKLQLSLDKLKLKNFLFQLINRIADGPDKALDQAEKQLQQLKLAYERLDREGLPNHRGRVLSLDLAKAVKSHLGEDFTLHSAELHETGTFSLSGGWKAD